MSDERLVSSLVYGLESRFILLTWAWCNSVECERLGLPGLPKRQKDNERLQARGAYFAARIRSEFMFSWLALTERYAREIDGGVVRRQRLDETMLWGGGQFLYDLFAAGCIRGPYRLPWDNAYAFRERVLKPAVSLMRSHEHDETMIFPPEAKRLLELRGLTFDF